MENDGPVGYKKLVAWQKADELVLAIYVVTKQFPREELFGVTSQLRRAAVSIPTNLVEGSGRQGKKELKQFVNMALGSLREVEYLLELCRRLGYLPNGAYEELDHKRHHVGKLLWGFYRSL